MPHEIKHTFICDICGKCETGANFTDSFTRPVGPQFEKLALPSWEWNFINDKLVCPAHTITVSHNGDSITVKEGSE